MMRKDAALPGVLVAALLVVLPASAHAGTYDVLTCNVPGADGRNYAWTAEPYNSAGKAVPSMASFTVVGGDAAKCAPTTGIGLATVAARRTVKVDDGAGWTFRAPAGTTIRRVEIGRNTAARASTNDPATPAAENGWWNVIARAGSGPGGQRVIAPETCVGNTATFCTTPAAGASSAVAYDIGEPVVSWGLQCAGPSVNSLCFTGDGTGNHAGINLHSARVTVDDPVAPAVDPGLVDGAFRRSGDPVVSFAADSAGIRSLRVLVDGVERAIQRTTCDYRFAAPCRPDATLHFDLTGVADGRHTVTTIAEDAATNLTRVERTVDLDSTPPVIDRVPVSGRTITAHVADALAGVAGGVIAVRRDATSPFVALKTTLRSGRLTASVPRSMSPSRIGISVTASDTAGNAVSSLVTSMSLSTRTATRFHKVRNARANVPYGRRVALSGRLTTTDGAPIAHQPLTVTSALRRTGALPETLATVVTDAAGRFRYTVAAGPSRKLAIAYAGNTGVLARSREVLLYTRASASIRASTQSIRGAGRIRFSGRLRLLGAALPPGGKIVVLEALQNGRWTTVRATRARGPNANWSATAQFRGNPGRFRLRLRIPREAAVFPYERGYSRSVAVRVR
jgi:hypothetical protein